MSKRKSKRKSQWSPPAVVGRVVWGRGGFKGAMRRTWRDWTKPAPKHSIRVDPDTGRLKAAGVRQRTDGRWEVKPSRPKKKVTAKQRIEQMHARVAQESDRHAAAQGARPKPMTQRVQRKPDGTFNGSTKATPETRADAAYLNAVRAAERAEARANKLLGY